MNKISIFVLLPIAALLGGILFATFYHKYDTSRNLFQDRNLTIEDLSGIDGNIVSLQKDSVGTIKWVVLGKWKFDVNTINNSNRKNSTVSFGANVTRERIDGLYTDKIILSNFTLAKSEASGEVATLDGTVTLVKEEGGSQYQNMSENDVNIPIHLVISNERTLKMFSDSNLFRSYFGSTPVYGNIPQRD